jgi:hypothetical protein
MWSKWRWESNAVARTGGPPAGWSDDTATPNERSPVPRSKTINWSSSVRTRTLAVLPP